MLSRILFELSAQDRKAAEQLFLQFLDSIFQLRNRSTYVGQFNDISLWLLDKITEFSQKIRDSLCDANGPGIIFLIQNFNIFIF